MAFDNLPITKSQVEAIVNEAIKPIYAQLEQLKMVKAQMQSIDFKQPVKFKIYKPVEHDPIRGNINSALLPWVYDQDRRSGFSASMWVTPVDTLPNFELSGDVNNVNIHKERDSQRESAKSKIMGCLRSHPHENMDKECEILTEIARLNAELRALRRE